MESLKFYGNTAGQISCFQVHDTALHVHKMMSLELCPNLQGMCMKMIIIKTLVYIQVLNISPCSSDYFAPKPLLQNEKMTWLFSF